MKKIDYLIILIYLSFSVLFGQNNQPNIDAEEKKLVIDAVCENLIREYVFPEITKKYIRILRDNFRSGKYNSIGHPEDFANEITKDLMSIHKDEHLTIRFNPEWIKNKKNIASLDEKAILLKKREHRISNYGFKEIKILPGNIGYLKLISFSYEIDAYNVAIGAVNFLANTDALIIDLRDNGGGSPEMVQFLCSYFFDNPRKHLNSFTYKEKEKSTQYWTYSYLPGKRLEKVDLYLLTSQRTFSAAEEFAYNLKHMRRAIVVGETTGGGAHDNKFVILNDHFIMSLPFARAINPITKTNWEGVGVKPDLNVSRDKALKKALILATKNMSEKEEDPEFKAFYLWHYETYRTNLNPVTINKTLLQSYVGTYGPRRITLEGNSLVYQREGQSKMKMIPIAEDRFMFNEIDYFRLIILKNGNKVIGVEGRYVDGRSDINLKNK